MNVKYAIFIFLSLSLFSSCSKINDLIPIEADKLIGESFAKQMAFNPMEGKMLDKTKNPKVYAYLEKIKTNILNSGKVKYKNDFVWELHIIENDSMLNAFCISGGYIYVYTGIIKFLDNEAELAGVLAHEIAHADNRHSTMRLVSQYGLSAIISLMTGGDASFIIQIGRELLGLTFSRTDEKQADDCAVAYLYATDYDPRAVGGFFKKLVSKNKENTVPEFLSTHPASENRVEDIELKWKELGGKEGKLFENEHLEIKKILK
ncbi:MAG: M48 family metalloprotease [Cytophagales bacterium]